jgi:hypothetical protein
MRNYKKEIITTSFKVEASITDHLRDSTLDLEKYKVVQKFHV